jgi:hypothetical protein
VVELLLHVRRKPAGKTLDVRCIYILDTSVLTSAASGLSTDRSYEVSFKKLDGLTVTLDARRRVNGGLKNLWSLRVFSEIADYDQSGALPNPMRCLDQPLINIVAETVPVSNPESFLSLVPVVHRKRRNPAEMLLSK